MFCSLSNDGVKNSTELTPSFTELGFLLMFLDIECLKVDSRFEKLGDTFKIQVNGPTFVPTAFM